MNSYKPLHGIRILSVEQFGAGPYGTMFLGALGADIIKIENATNGGDPARYTEPFLLGAADSEYFQTWNMNKRSVLLDLKSAVDLSAFRELVAGADAVVNNLRGDLPAKLGLDYATLSKLKRGIVCLHISAYGRDNERASWPGYDYLMQAESGLMDLTGEPDGPPSRFGAPSVIDHMTGMISMVGLLSAMLGARSTGRGCDVDVNLLDVALHQLGYAATWYLNEGVISTRQPRSAHFSVAPAQTLRTKDGWVFIMCMTDKFWQELVTAIHKPELSQDPRFSTPKARYIHRSELTEMIERELARRTTQEWLRTFEGHLPIAPILDVATALDSEFLNSTDMIASVPHPERNDFRVLNVPLKIDGKRLDLRRCSALGADNGAILTPRAGPESTNS
jgi:crotonobetainyl-CoA:carnitine CoA-transferase CaiB-like acyl-CoA transferase